MSNQTTLRELAKGYAKGAIDKLVEEFNDPEWVRGGTPTRQIVKDLDYLQRGRDSDENKEYIKGKKAYVHKCLKQ